MEVEEMKKLEQQIKEVLIDKEIMLENWKLRIINIEGKINSDYRNVTVEILKPHYRKPCVTWLLNINIVKQFIDFTNSSFYK